MAVLTVQRPTPGTALNPTYAAAAGGGDSYPASGNEIVHAKNGSGAPITLTVEGPNTDNFGVSGNDHDQPYTIPAAGERFIRVSDMLRHRDANGSVQLTYSGVTDLTLAILSA